MKSLVCSVISLSLLWFLPSVSGIVNNEFGACDFEQPILSGRKYPIYSPNYPANYPPGTKCRWKAKSDQPIQITCMIFSIPESPNCRDGYLSIKISSKPAKRFCGARMFSIVSEENEIDARLISSPASEGGYFLCAVKQLSQVVATKPVTNNCRCGWKNPTRIAYGNDTGVNEYPMMAIIIILPRQIQCGATIINDKQVITAAHCLNNKVPRNIMVVVGEHDLSISDETEAIRLFRARSFIIHELYNQTSLDYDIALINIAGTITFSQLVGPVCLPFKHNHQDFEGKPVEILGWGSRVGGESPSNVLQKATVNVISPESCSKAYPNRIGPRQICTLDETRDSCQYDSGGPVLWRNPETRRVILVAIIDYGMLCSSGSPSVNVDVSNYVDWIVSKKP
ncbi:GSCOCG00001852001-RA-CDS, partial [Cotesia congregata]